MAAKRVISRQHLDVFTNGQTHADVVKFIETLNTATVGISLRQTCNGSSIITTILGILDDIEALADRTPPVDNEKSRFGNPAFRTFYGLVNEVREHFAKSRARFAY
ncbi:Serine/threonine-protein phosphatase 2A activator 2 [Cystobasidiomycetes sp. EMM_F5]